MRAQPAPVLEIQIVPDAPAPYWAGQVVDFDVLIQQTGGASERLRMVQFDLSLTDPALMAGLTFPPLADSPFGFWDFTLLDNCPGACGTNHYITPLAAPFFPPFLASVYLGMVANDMEQFVLPADGAVRVGRVRVTMPAEPGTYSLDLYNHDAVSSDEGALVLWGFGLNVEDYRIDCSPAQVGCQFSGGAVDVQVGVSACCGLDGTCSDNATMCDGIQLIGQSCDGAPCAALGNVNALGCRYLGIEAPLGALGDVLVALRVTSPAYPCMTKYVAVDSGIGRLIDSPVFLTVSEWDGLIVADSELVPGVTYEINSVPFGAALSGVTATLRRWGDVVAPLGQVNFGDISAAVNCFRHSPSAPPVEACDVYPAIPDQSVDFLDISAVVGAFQGLPYPFAGPCP